MTATIYDFYKAQRYLRVDSVYRGTLKRLEAQGKIKRQKDLLAGEPSLVPIGVSR